MSEAAENKAGPVRLTISADGDEHDAQDGTVKGVLLHSLFLLKMSFVGRIDVQIVVEIDVQIVAEID